MAIPLAPIARTAGEIAINMFLDSVVGALDKPEVEYGDRVRTLPALTGHEGRPIDIVFGPQNRVGGTIIWNSELIEVRTVEEVGEEKKGEPDTAVKYEYYIHLAIGICEGPIESIRRMWANGRLIYRLDTTETVTSDNVQTIKRNLDWGEGSRVTQVMVFNDGEDLSGFYTNELVTISGCSKPENNGTFVILQVKQLDSGKWQMLLDNVNCDSESAGSTITAEQEVDPMPSWVAYRVTAMAGDYTQTANPLIDANVADVPGYRGIAYIVFERFGLLEWGNRVPTITFEVVEASTRTVAEVIVALFERAGIDSGDLDTSELTDTIHGFSFQGTSSISEALSSLVAAYDVAFVDTGEIIKIIPRDNGDAVTVNENDLGADDGESEADIEVLEISDLPDSSLPNEIVVNYVDATDDYNQGSQRERLTSCTTPQNEASVDVSVVLTAGEARTIAARTLYRFWRERSEVSITLPPRYIQITPFDRLTITRDGMSYVILVKSVDVGANFLVEVEGTILESYNAT